MFNSHNTIFKYLFKCQFLPLIVIISAVTLVMLMIQLTRIIDIIIGSDLALNHLLQLSYHLLPYILYIVFPIGVLISSIYILRKLSTEKIVLVMQSIGMSNLQMASPIMYFTFICLIFHYLISLYILPISFRNFQTLQLELRNNYALTVIGENTFTTKINNVVIYVDKKINKNSFAHVFIYDTRQKDKLTLISAESVDLVQDTKNNAINLILNNGFYQENDLITGRYFTILFSQYKTTLKIDKEPNLTNSLTINERFINQLIAPKDVLDKQKHDRIVVYGHQRLLWPLYSFLIVIVNLATLLSHGSRVTNKHSILIAFGLNFLLLINSVILQNLALKYHYLIIAMYANVLLPSILAYIKLRN